MLEEIDLYAMFHTFNKKYFGGKLPPCKLRFRKLKKEFLGITVTTVNAHPRTHTIKIQQEFRKWDSVAIMILLHEMVHVSLPLRVMHGPRFEREMQRLAKAGAFKGTW